METIHLQNTLWEVEIAPALGGRIVKLVDRAGGIARVQPPQLAANAVAEGGHAPFLGLDLWVKSGCQPDPNTGVLSAFAPIHGTPLTVETMADGARLRGQQAGLALTIEWRLPAGEAPLSCRMTLANDAAPADDFQFEGFFIWHVPEEGWTGTAVAFPGLPPFTLKPYGEIHYEGGGEDEGCAAWWTRGTAEGVAMRGRDGLLQFFTGVHGNQFILGPHSAARRLAPGDALTLAVELAPLAWAQARGWDGASAAAEAELATRDQRAAQTAARVGSLAEWVQAPTPSPIARRAFHLTVQYAPADLRRTIDLLEQVVAPLGFNQLMVEVDRAFPYRSHPKVGVEWAWSRTQWAEFIAAARGLGFDLIPQYNALGHQGESGLATAFPEMAEDPGRWNLCPRHPQTVPYLCDLFDELIEVFSPAIFHIGLDEVDVPSRPQTFCICPRCAGADGGALFADHINALYRHLANRGQEVIMWADMLLHKEAHNSVNGLRTGMWRAVDALPREIIMLDWVYSPVAAYGGSDYLLEKGFRVMGSTWHTPRAIADFTRYAVERDLYGMCQTTWANPTLRDWPAIPVLTSGKYFMNPALPDLAQAVSEAEALASALTGDQARVP